MPISAAVHTPCGANTSATAVSAYSLSLQLWRIQPAWPLPMLQAPQGGQTRPRYAGLFWSCHFSHLPIQPVPEVENIVRGLAVRFVFCHAQPHGIRIVIALTRDNAVRRHRESIDA